MRLDRLRPPTRPQSRLHHRFRAFVAGSTTIILAAQSWLWGTQSLSGPVVPTPPTTGTGGKAPNIPSSIGVPGGAPNNLLAVSMYLTQLVSGLNNWTAQAANAVNYSLIQSAPARRNSKGTAGQIAFDGNYLYICIATNTWARVAVGGSW